MAEVKVNDPFEVLLYPVLTEKAISLIERENTITFIVDRRANKEKIKKAFENMFKVKVRKVRTLIDAKGRKKAYIAVSKDYNATDIAAKLGII